MDKGYIVAIEQETKDNTDFRRVLYTAKHSQLVLMSLKPGEEIGEETHQVDQFIRMEIGHGKAVLNGVEHKLAQDSAGVIPAGTKHNIINSDQGEMKLYTVYAPPEHKDGTVHKTKAEAEKAEE
ncbi:MAG: cupin domain-containing protein [Candidatus Andersenbacteria bacterium]